MLKRTVRFLYIFLANIEYDFMGNAEESGPILQDNIYEMSLEEYCCEGELMPTDGEFFVPGINEDNQPNIIEPNTMKIEKNSQIEEEDFIFR